MKKATFKNDRFWQKVLIEMLILLITIFSSIPVFAQNPPAPGEPVKQEGTKDEAVIKKGLKPGLRPHKEIVVEEIDESLESRLQRKITLDVREMNVIDVLKFLALKGDFNLITSNAVSGRVTLYLKNVLIQDAMDIILIANNLAYHLEHDIVHVMAALEYEAIYGKKFNDKNIVEIIQLKYAKPLYVRDALDSYKSNLGKIVIDEDTGSVVLIDNPETVEKMKAMIQEMEKPLQPLVFALQYGKADVIAEKLKERIDAHAVGSISIDERTNKIVIRALPEREKEVVEILKSLDAPTKEVLVEVRVLQVVFKPEYDFGIDWELDFRNSKHTILKRTSFKNIMMDESTLSTSSNLYSNFSKIGLGNFDTDSFEMSIRALKQVSNTRILSNPKILVTNNQEAQIHVGDTVPYIISTTSGTGDNAITSEDVRFVDVGLKLNVTPNINDDGFVTMALKPEISTVVGLIDSQGGGIPQVNKTLVETTVLVKDGTTIVLGGLRKDNKTHVTKGIPGLMDIPFIKNLFSNTQDEIESTEIVIFITPHIMTGKDNFKKYRGDIKTVKEFESDEEKEKEKIVEKKRLELKK